MTMPYAHLYTLTNHSFLQSASHPEELVAQAHALNYSAIAITDECSLAGIVKAYKAAKALSITLIVGSYFKLSNATEIIVIAPNRTAYSELSGFITLARRRSAKGKYEAHFADLRFRLQHCLIIFIFNAQDHAKALHEFKQAFNGRLWLGINIQRTGNEAMLLAQATAESDRYNIPLLACGKVAMHDKSRKPLYDVLTAIRANTPLNRMGTRLCKNAEHYLKPLDDIMQLYPHALIEQTHIISQRCDFSMDELRYQYPQELVPKHHTPIEYLRSLVSAGAKTRWPKGTPPAVQALINKELRLTQELHYEFYFLTVHDIVNFARREGILCQGRGSAANSMICYCLHITEISPERINVLFERFISKERDEPPDIDVDFEHQRREEVIQYIYQKYTRQRAALAASVITYRTRSAIRDVGKALGFDNGLIDQLSKSLAWWDSSNDIEERFKSVGIHSSSTLIKHFYALIQQILGFPRHLSQHVGGFVITQDKLSDLVPIENASMAERTVIQWDKDDLETMGLMKVDILALGMLTALQKSIRYVQTYMPNFRSLADIPEEDSATYAMLSRGDSIGVFQVESRAQISMLPRLKPQTFYDLVIEIAIVRPGPIQGDMVHPYLRRRDGIEAITYQSEDIKAVLSPTLGVPIFQEQAIRLAMVAAGFSGGRADQLRRAMASWGKNSNLLTFETDFIAGMIHNGYDEAFAQKLFSQIMGFGGYGFPESHSASFAILCYFSSWLKCHHPAAFYCALLNSQPMGFYSASQLIQDARRHAVKIYPLDINLSHYDNQLTQKNNTAGDRACDWGIRLGLCRVKSLATVKALAIEHAREHGPFDSIDDLAHRASLSQSDLQRLAAADAFHSLAAHRYQAHWDASAVTATALSTTGLLDLNLDLQHQPSTDEVLNTRPPSLEKDILLDMKTTGISLRAHPMALLRHKPPFNACKTQHEMQGVGNGRFVQVAGLVTCRQRPGTANGTVFLTLEDETGNINIVVRKTTQSAFRQALLHAKILIIKGRLETKHQVMHVIAGHLHDATHHLSELSLSSRDFH